jgi:hypothetical protein
MHVHLARGQRFSALGTDHHRVEHLSAALMLVELRPPAFVYHVDVATVRKRNYINGGAGGACFGQAERE